MAKKRKQNTAALIEPGQPLTVTLETGREVEAVSLGMRGKRRAVAILQSIQGQGNDVGVDELDQLYDLIEEAIRICIPGASEDTIDSFNETTALDLLQKTLAGQAVGADAAKK